MPHHDAPRISDTVAKAIALHKQDQLGKAERFYREVLRADAGNFDALHLLGVLKQQQGQSGEAASLIAAALQVNPGSARGLSN